MWKLMTLTTFYTTKVSQRMKAGMHSQIRNSIVLCGKYYTTAHRGQHSSRCCSRVTYFHAHHAVVAPYSLALPVLLSSRDMAWDSMQ
jgi:hypothetical protein